MRRKNMVHVNVRNGMTLGYTVALVNSILELMISFGIHVTDSEHAAIMSVANLSIMLVARVLNLPYKPANPEMVDATAVPTPPTQPPTV